MAQQAPHIPGPAHQKIPARPTTTEPLKQDLPCSYPLGSKTKECPLASSTPHMTSRHRSFPSVNSSDPLCFNALDLHSHGLQTNIIHLCHETPLVLLVLNFPNTFYLALSVRNLEMVQRIHSRGNLMTSRIWCGTFLREEFHTRPLSSIPRLRGIQNLILLKLSLGIGAFTCLDGSFSLIIYFVDILLLFS